MTTVKVLVGTKKGAFIYTSDEKRESWQVSKPLFTGWTVLHMAGDARGPQPRLYAAATHWAWGPSVARSTDGGETWESRSPGLGFPADMGEAVQNVWDIAPGHESQPGVVWAGTQPAGLFRSEDWGESWSSVDSITRHERRPTWTGTGGGDSAVNSIEIDPRDPRRMYVSISAGGSFVSDDGGDSWKQFLHTAMPTNPHALRFRTEMAKAFPEPPPVPDDIDPLAVDELHKLRMDRKSPDRLWAQAHIGVFHSNDAGASWQDVTVGLPSMHGFPIAVTKRDADAVFVVPLAFEGLYDNFRVCDGQFTVYRTRDSGKTWEPMTKGLPGPHDYQSVYRQGLDTDGLEREGVYVGTSNGEVYASTDVGESWQRLPGTLPPILSVSCAVS